MSATEHRTGSVVVEFHYDGGDYRLEVEPSVAERLAAAEKTFAPVRHGRTRLRELLRHRAPRAPRAAAH